MALIDIKQIAWTALRTYFLRKDAADSTPYKLTANGFDASSAEITHVGTATADSSAPNLAQVKALVAEGDYRGMITGYVKLVSSTPTLYINNDTTGNTVTGSVANGGLYLILEDMTWNGTRKAGDVVYYNNSVYTCDNTLGSFNTTSAAADPAGALTGCTYLLKLNSQSGHDLPGYIAGTGAFTDGTFIKWNPEYDSSANNNIGRWNFFGSDGNVPTATKTTQGRMQAWNGIAISSGLISADIDTARGLSWSSGTDGYLQYGVQVNPSYLEFVGGAVSVKSGIFAPFSHTHTAADVPVRGMFTDSFTGITLSAAGSTKTLNLTYGPVIPTGVSAANYYKCVSVYINGVRQSFALTTKPILSAAVFTLQRDSIEYAVAATDVIDVVYIPAV